MIPLVWLRVIILAAIVSFVGSMGYLGYAKIKQIGYDEAAAKYELVIAAHQKAVTEKIDNIELLSNTLAIQNRETNVLLLGDISTILKGIRGKTLTIVKNGECTPAPTFSDTFNTINSRTNQALKESQK